MEAAIKEIVKKYPVVVYSKSYCPYCHRVKKALADKGYMDGAYVLELDQEANGDQVQGALLSLTRQRTVPNVFVAGQHIGGSDDTLAALKNGTIQKLMASL